MDGQMRIRCVRGLGIMHAERTWIDGWMDGMERIGDTILVRSANVDQIPR